MKLTSFAVSPALYGSPETSVTLWDTKLESNTEQLNLKQSAYKKSGLPPVCVMTNASSSPLIRLLFRMFDDANELVFIFLAMNWGA